MNPQGSDAERNLGETQFKDFVMGQFRGLCERECPPDGSSSTLKVFCRMDVSLMVSGSGKLGYFVNEVERTNTASLWMSLLDADTRNSVRECFRNALIKWFYK